MQSYGNLIQLLNLLGARSLLLHNPPQLHRCKVPSLPLPTFMAWQLLLIFQQNFS